jgi:hypothetical protein
MLAVVVERTLSESVFCIAPGQYAKSKFDWQQETPTQRSAGLFTARSPHPGTLPRLDTPGFQMLYHYCDRRRGAKLIFPSFLKKNKINAFKCENERTFDVNMLKCTIRTSKER